MLAQSIPQHYVVSGSVVPFVLSALVLHLPHAWYTTQWHLPFDLVAVIDLSHLVQSHRIVDYFLC